MQKSLSVHTDLRACPVVYNEVHAVAYKVVTYYKLRELAQELSIDDVETFFKG